MLPARFRHFAWVLPVLSGTLLAGTRAQTIIDDGMFRLLVAGREVGTERFWIKQNGEGGEAVIFAHATVVIDTTGTREEVTTLLKTARGSLRTEAYERQTLSGDTLRAAVSGSRITVRARGRRGDTVREFLLGDNSHLLDDGIAHQYHLLARDITGTGTGRVRILAPASAWQAWATVASAAAEPITIDGEPIPATRITVTPENGHERIVWVDANGRVLRFEIPERQFVAERITGPR